MRSITEYPRKEIERGIQKARKNHDQVNDHVRILFAPNMINDKNFERVCDIYSRLAGDVYDTVVIIEEHHEVLDKKLPMASNGVFKTPLGTVPVDDYMRNEFCDEDDDFFIHDEAFSKDMSLFQQLMMLQVSLDNFKALSIQIADESHFIIKELAHVLEEVLVSRNVLLVFCCDLKENRKKEFKRLKKMVEDKAHSNLFNFLNSDDSFITGIGAFVTGILVADKWDLHFNFNNEEAGNRSLITFADREHALH